MVGMADSLQDFKAGFFRTLASPIRIRLLEQLRGGEATVGDLQQKLGLDSSNVSQHLSILRANSLVAARRDGTRIWYSVQEPHIYEILDAARAIFENQVRASTRLLAEPQRARSAPARKGRHA
jgi:ArsR family transcriptional regulator